MERGRHGRRRLVSSRRRTSPRSRQRLRCPPGQESHPHLRSRPSLLRSKQEHHLILQVNTNDPAAMNLALNNATNVTQYYKEMGEKVKIEVVTFGPGLNMLRDDTSPVKARIETLALSSPEISYKACGNTQENMQQGGEQGYPDHSAGSAGQVRRHPHHAAAGAGLDLRQAVSRFDRLQFQAAPTARRVGWWGAGGRLITGRTFLQEDIDARAQLTHRSRHTGLEHDPEKCEAVFRKDHARTIS